MEFVVKSIALFLVLCAIADSRPQNGYGNNNYNNDNNNYNYYDKAGDYNDVGSDQSDNAYDNYDDDSNVEQPRPYNFRYNIKDDQSGADFGQTETSDGQVIKGEYRVQLPDGRFQVVKYTADWENGYNAEVTYEGEAYYPETKKGNSGDGFQGYGNQVEENYSQNNHDSEYSRGDNYSNDDIYRSASSDDLLQVFRQPSVYDDSVSNPLPSYGSNNDYDNDSAGSNDGAYGGRL